jgi:RNA polymerase sigma factor (TIGR02999 family)
VDQNRIQWSGRAHFFGAAAQVMRRVLVDRARERLAQKRGDGAVHEPLEAAIHIGEERPFSLIALDMALNELAEMDPERVRLVELRYFGGLSLPETAVVMQLSKATVKRDWALARAWLFRRLGGVSSATPPPPL